MSEYLSWAQPGGYRPSYLADEDSVRQAWEASRQLPPVVVDDDEDDDIFTLRRKAAAYDEIAEALAAVDIAGDWRGMEPLYQVKALIELYTEGNDGTK